MRLALLFGLALLIWALPELTRRLGGRVPVALWVAVANPMMVINMIGGGHNDLLVVGFLAAGALFALRGKARGRGSGSSPRDGRQGQRGARPAVPRAGVGRPDDRVPVGPHRKAAAAGVGSSRSCSVPAPWPGVDLGRLPARSAPSMIVNWMSIPTAVGQIVGGFASCSAGRTSCSSTLRGDRRPRCSCGSPCVSGGRRVMAAPTRSAARASSCSPRRSCPPRRSPGTSAGAWRPGDGPLDGARAAVPGRRFDHAGGRLLPQRRGRALQLGLPRGVAGGRRARSLVAGAARPAPARCGRPEQERRRDDANPARARRPPRARPSRRRPLPRRPLRSPRRRSRPSSARAESGVGRGAGRRRDRRARPARAYASAARSTPATAAPTSSRPGCSPVRAAPPCTRSTASPGTPTRSSTTSPTTGRPT